MIYLKNHKENINNELQHYAENKFNNEKITHSFIHSEFPAKIHEEIAASIEVIFARNIWNFLIEYGEEHNLTFSQLREMVTKTK